MAASGLLFLAPFGVSNFLAGQIVLGVGASVIVLVLALLAHMAYKGRHSNISLLLFPPVLAFLLVALSEQGVIGIMWTYPAVVCFYFIFRERWAWIANAITIMTVVPLSVTVLETAIALRAMATIVVVSVFSIMAVRVISAQQTRLGELAVTDSLTGLLNRSLLTPSLAQAMAHNNKTGEPATLLALDIDYFKNINDTFGHQTGDQVLAEVAELLKRRLRSSDLVFRTGGEEFMILLPDTAGEPGHHVAHLLRSAVAGENLLDSHPITVSVGVTTLTEGDTLETWFARADQCLYQAKNSGRNCVITDEPSSPRLAVSPEFR